jgi:predicted nuclease of predicted toxin-antitoxin system
MKMLLDECIDKRLVRSCNGLYVKTVPQMGWASVKNGKLLALAENEFDIFITVDRNLSFQQNTINLDLECILEQGS